LREAGARFDRAEVAERFALLRLAVFRRDEAAFAVEGFLVAVALRPVAALGPPAREVRAVIDF